MIADLAPVGPIEASLADRAALLMWRLRRVANAEQAQHRLSLDDIGWQATDEGQREFSHFPLRDGATEKRDQADESEYMERLSSGPSAWQHSGRTRGLIPKTLSSCWARSMLAQTRWVSTPRPGQHLTHDAGTAGRPASWKRRSWNGWDARSTATETPILELRWLDAAVSFLLRQSIRRGGQDYRYRIRTVRLTAERRLLDTQRFERIAKQDSHLSRALYRTLAELHRLQDRREGAAARRSKAGQAGKN